MYKAVSHAYSHMNSACIHALGFGYCHASLDSNGYTLVSSHAICAVSDTPTCVAMDTLAHDLANEHGDYCWTFDPCYQLRCVEKDTAIEYLHMTLYPCNKPPALRYVFWIARDILFTDHLFNRSEAVTSSYSGFVIGWNVTLTHLEHGIGFEVGSVGSHIHSIDLSR